MQTLTEWRKSDPIRLTRTQREGLEKHFAASIETGPTDDTFRVTPGNVVGSVTIGGETFVVTPKIPIDRVLFMVAYAADPFSWEDGWASLAGSKDLVEGMAALFVRTCDRVLARGLYRSYHRVEDAGRTIRGRVVMQRWARRPAPLPIDVRYQVHDDDVLENQLVRAALDVLRTTRIRSREVAAGVARHWRAFRDLGRLPDPLHAARGLSWNRQNIHYVPLVRLAQVIIGGRMAELERGVVQVPGFTLNMPEVFERFVRTALRERSGLSTRAFPDDTSGFGLTLDAAGRVRLVPDLGVRDEDGWQFVGDVKYKRDEGTGKHPDLYQLFACATATRLDEATLIYADGPFDAPSHEVRYAGVTLRLVHLDLARPPAEILEQLSRVQVERPSAGQAAG